MKVIHKEKLKQITFLDERYYFDEDTQAYYPSVTTVLNVYPKGYGFNQWLKDLGSNADEVVKRAAEQGSRIHEAIENFLNGNEILWIGENGDNYSLDEWVMIGRFIEFYQKHEPEVIAVETSLASAELGFGGTLDLVCKLPAFPDDIWYIDHKSGNGVYKTNKIQAAACQKLWNSQRKEKITRLGCLHLRARTRGDGRNGTIQGNGWKVEEVQDPDKMYRLFEHSMALWKEENPNPKPKNEVMPDRFSIQMLKERKEKNDK
jgi:hypothetical protein